MDLRRGPDGLSVPIDDAGTPGGDTAALTLSGAEDV
jgi:hypothetical protein